MALSAFEDKSHRPKPNELKSTLGKAGALWDELISNIAERFAPVTQVWAFSGANYGWSLRLKRNDRVLIYLTPQAGSFQAGIVLGDRAMKAARNEKLPADVVDILDTARRYAEGTGLRIPVSKKATVAAVERLVKCKMGG